MTKENKGIPVNRIFCIGRNYVDHAKELGNEVPDEPVVFMKPASALRGSGDEILIPDFADEVHYETELVVQISKEGYNISEKDAQDYISGITVGLDLTLRGIQSELKEKGLPWERAKAFDGSALLGNFVPFDKNIDLENLKFQCLVNDKLKQDGNTANMLFPVKKIITILSTWWQLAPDDIIYTGTPQGVGPLKPGDKITILSEHTGVFSWTVK